jgi:hypothetical protein
MDLVPCPVIPARTLLTLGPAEFVLAVNWPGPRLINAGLLVPARLRASPVTGGPATLNRTAHDRTGNRRTGSHQEARA